MANGVVLGLRFKEAREGFFDRSAITNTLSKQERFVLSRFGAFVRQTATRSIVDAPSKGVVSRPGSPPLSHVGRLRQKIFFAYDRERKGVVIGPVLYNRRRRNVVSDKTVPELLEYGGEAQIVTRRSKASAIYKPRPYMSPAFEKELKSLPRIWAESVK